MSRSRPTPTVTSLLALQGPDALTFAHTQFTSNVAALDTGKWQWSAWLDARGRVQFVFQLARADEHTLLVVLRGGDAAAMAGRLERYLFRSRVALTPRPDLFVHGGSPRPAAGFEATDGSYCLGMGDRSLVLSASQATGDTGWRLDAIRHGEPWLPDTFLDTFLPPALGLHRLGATSLDKGCYPGQEIVARLHYHGGHKHALAHLRLPTAVEPGAGALPVHADADAIEAQVLDCVPAEGMHEALAVLHESAFARLGDAHEPANASTLLMRRFPA